MPLYGPEMKHKEGKEGKGKGRDPWATRPLRKRRLDHVRPFTRSAIQINIANASASTFSTVPSYTEVEAVDGGDAQGCRSGLATWRHRHV